jgi:hypothetical protein
VAGRETTGGLVLGHVVVAVHDLDGGEVRELGAAFAQADPGRPEGMGGDQDHASSLLGKTGEGVRFLFASVIFPQLIPELRGHAIDKDMAPVGVHFHAGQDEESIFPAQAGQVALVRGNHMVVLREDKAIEVVFAAEFGHVLGVLSGRDWAVPGENGVDVEI